MPASLGVAGAANVEASSDSEDSRPLLTNTLTEVKPQCRLAFFSGPLIRAWIPDPHSLLWRLVLFFSRWSVRLCSALPQARAWPWWWQWPSSCTGTTLRRGTARSGAIWSALGSQEGLTQRTNPDIPLHRRWAFFPSVFFWRFKTKWYQGFPQVAKLTVDGRNST